MHGSYSTVLWEAHWVASIKHSSSLRIATMIIDAAEREWNHLKGFQDFCLKNGSSQGQNLALAAICVPNSLDTGHSRRREPTSPHGGTHQPSEWDYSVFFNRGAVYHKSPHCGERAYKSRN